MIGYVMVGTNNLDRAATFYDSVLTPLDLIQVERTSTYVAFAPKAAKGDIEFLAAKGDAIAFTRREGNEQLVCAFNLGDQPAEIGGPPTRVSV